MSRNPSDVEQAWELLKRYDRPGPRYTSYPTAVEFSEQFDSAAYLAKLAEADQAVDESLSLYVHLPFCAHRCSYCGCNVIITERQQIIGKYLSYLKREFALLADRLPRRRTVTQLHWGGGTPTALAPAQMRELHAEITKHFEIAAGAEMAIEVDPRVTNREHLEQLLELGFNRISLGVQDLSPEVQQAIDRNQTDAQTADLHGLSRELGFESINFDLVYGLPRQTVSGFTATIDRLLELRPDRVAIYSYAHVPWIQPHQKRIDDTTLPDTETKLRLFCTARELLIAGGYEQIGMDHFALPGDELVAASRAGRLHRNFMGYTTKSGSDMIGTGISAIGDVQGCFAQNTKKLPRYYGALDAGTLPIAKGYALDADDLIRREVIKELMCNFRLERQRIEQTHDIEFGRYFATELAELSAPDGPVEHGFLTVEDDAITVTGWGRLFVRNLCMVFDRYMRSRDGGKPVFSRTV